MTTPPNGPEDRPQDQPHQPPGQPPQYGQPPYGQSPYQQGYGYGGGPGGSELAGWGSRVGAALIDGLISGVPAIVGYVIFFVDLGTSGDDLYSDRSPGLVSGLLLGLGVLASIGLWVWNRVIRQGNTGQSVGKSVVNIKLVDSAYLQVIGPGRALLRDILRGIFDNACLLNSLWPLWDDKKQTWHDKVMSTYVIKV